MAVILNCSKSQSNIDYLVQIFKSSNLVIPYRTEKLSDRTKSKVRSMIVIQIILELVRKATPKQDRKANSW